jgi:hypothetical protein
LRPGIAVSCSADSAAIDLLKQPRTATLKTLLDQSDTALIRR